MIRSELEMPERLKTDTQSLRPDYAKYSAEPFERGLGQLSAIHYAESSFPQLKVQQLRLFKLNK